MPNTENFEDLIKQQLLARKTIKLVEELAVGDGYVFVQDGIKVVITKLSDEQTNVEFMRMDKGEIE